MINRTHLIVGALGLLVVLPFVGGCSSGSDFWDRSPCVGGIRQDYCPNPCTPPRQCCPPQQCAPRYAPRQQYAPRPQQQAPYAPPQVQQPAQRPPSTANTFPPPAPQQQSGPATGEEMEVLRHVNGIRARHGLRPLRFNDRLYIAARDHSLEQQRHGYMGHGSPDPKRAKLSQRIAQAGYHGSAYAEVVAWGYRTTASVVEGWMNSSGHRAILLDGDLTEAGFSRAGQYWTGNFGTPLRYGTHARARTPAPRRAAPTPRYTPARPAQRPAQAPRQAPVQRAPQRQAPQAVPYGFSNPFGGG